MSNFSLRYVGWEESYASKQVRQILQKRFFLVEEDYDFLVNFGPTIFTKEDLSKAKIASINFHTGPPRWPGRKSAERALCAGDKTFGVTAHIMEPELDSGLILDVIEFDIPAHCNAEKLKKMAFDRIQTLATHFCQRQWRRRAYKAADPIESEVPHNEIQYRYTALEP